MTPKDENHESHFNRKDVYTRVTDRIIADLENGIRSWMKPWSGEHAAGRISRPLRHNGIPYRGMNILLLWGEAMEKGYAAPIWMTFKQFTIELKAHVRKGERSALVVYAMQRYPHRDGRGKSGEDVERSIPFMKGYAVFNVEQIEGLPEHYYAKPENPLPLSERIESADRFMTATGASISHGGNSAFYAPGPDRIQMPPFEAFRDNESYYATALHGVDPIMPGSVIMPHKHQIPFAINAFLNSCRHNRRCYLNRALNVVPSKPKECNGDENEKTAPAEAKMTRGEIEMGLSAVSAQPARTQAIRN